MCLLADAASLSPVVGKATHRVTKGQGAIALKTCFTDNDEAQELVDELNEPGYVVLTTTDPQQDAVSTFKSRSHRNLLTSQQFYPSYSSLQFRSPLSSG
jgi:hypothetical protein